MAISNYDRVTKVMELLKAGLQPFVEREMKAQHNQLWLQEARASVAETQTHLFTGSAEPEWDAASLLAVMWNQWEKVFRKTFAVGGAAVILNAVGVHVEPVGVLVVLKCVDVDGDSVVGVDLLARRDAGTDLGGIVPADPADIEVFAVVGEIRSRGLAHRLAIVRIELFEDYDYRLRLTGRVIEEIGELWSATDTWNLERRQFNGGANNGKNGGGQHRGDSKPDTAERKNGNHEVPNSNTSNHLQNRRRPEGN